MRSVFFACHPGRHVEEVEIDLNLDVGGALGDPDEMVNWGSPPLSKREGNNYLCDFYPAIHAIYYLLFLFVL